MSDAFQLPPVPPAAPVAPIPAYRCGLADTQRRVGNLCGKAHCAGCAPFRLGLTGPAVAVAAPAPGQALAAVPASATPTAYISRTEHEILLARAVRESYESRRGDRRDLFIAAVISGLAAGRPSEPRDPTEARDLARRTLEIVDELLLADEKEK